MEGHRYADDEPSWYAGPGRYAHTTDPETSGIHERPSGAFRLPEQRPAAPMTNPYALGDPLSTTGSHSFPGEARIPVRGPEYPTIRPTTAEPMAPPASVPAPPPIPEPPALPLSGPTSLVPPVAARPETPPFAARPESAPFAARPESAPVARPDSVYQSRRPISSFLVAIVMVVLLIPVVRLLIESTFTGDPSARGIVPAVLLTLGFTLSGIGLFTIARGGTITRETWLRPPVAYLPVGLILLLAAGLAVA